MSRIENSVFCDNCGVEVTWAPVIWNQLDICCEDCRDGYPCGCGDRMELDDERRMTYKNEFLSGLLVDS